MVPAERVPAERVPAAASAAGAAPAAVSAAEADDAAAPNAGGIGGAPAMAMPGRRGNIPAPKVATPNANGAPARGRGRRTAATAAAAAAAGAAAAGCPETQEVHARHDRRQLGGATNREARAGDDGPAAIGRRAAETGEKVSKSQAKRNRKKAREAGML